MQETMKDNDIFLKQLEHWNQQGEYEKTIQEIIHLSEAERDSEVLCLLAEALHAKNMNKEALRALNQITPKARKQAKWYSVYSRVLYSLQRYAEALTAVDLLLQLTPEDTAARELLLQCQEHMLWQQMDLPFQQRVDDFWDLFAEQEAIVRDMMEQQADPAAVRQYVNELLKNVFRVPVFYLEKWEGRYQLILSPDGNRTTLYGMVCWQMRAPESLMEYWDFIVGQLPAEEPEQIKVAIGEYLLSPAQIQVWPQLLQDGRVGITCYHEALLLVEQNDAYAFLHQLLNQCIGELSVIANLGYVQILELPENDFSMTLDALNSFLAELQADGTLSPQNDPLGLFTTYDMHSEYEDWGLREDVFAGSISAAALPILNSYYMNDTFLFEDAALDGMVWVFVFYSCETVAREERINVRGEIEKELSQKLSETKFAVGECVGGASGYHYCYLDCVCYNLEQFIRLTKQVMASYIGLYQLKEAGVCEFRKNGRYFSLCDDLPQPAVFAKKQEEEETLLTAWGAQQYLLHHELHKNFMVETIVEGEHLYLPQWQLTITPLVTEMKKTAASVDFLLAHPQWDRIIIEQATGLGAVPQDALKMAAESFLEMIAPVFFHLFGMPEESTVRSDFAGKEHIWNCYSGRSHTSMKEPLDYWSLFRDEIIKRLGNQKVCYIEFYGAKTEEIKTGVCRLNHIECAEISQQIEELVQVWDAKGFVVQKQVVFLQQQADTWQAYPYTQQQLCRLTWQAAEIFLEEDYDMVLERLQEVVQDDVLAEELFLFLPEICAEHAFDKITYPELLTLDREGEIFTVYRQQIHSYTIMQQAMFWGLEYGVFDGRENEIYSRLIAVSSVFSAIEDAKEQGIDLEQDGGTVNTVYSVSRKYQLR